MQYDHPLDNLYRDKINKLKILAATLPIGQIDQERQSWLRESSLLQSSKTEMDNSSKLQKQKQKGQIGSYLVDQISEQSSIFEKQDWTIKQDLSNYQSQSQQLVRDSGLKTKRSYRKQNKSKNKKYRPIKHHQMSQVQKKSQALNQAEIIDNIRNTMLKTHIQSINRQNILENNYNLLKTQSQIQKAEELRLMILRIEQKKKKLADMKNQKREIQKKIQIVQRLSIS